MNRFTVILIAVMAASCSGGAKTPTGPTTAANPQPTPAPSLSLAGTWTGTLNDPQSNVSVRINSWTAIQSGANVSGTMVMDVGQGTLVNATLTGTASGSQLASATFTVAAGAISGLPTCSMSGTGTQAATATSVSGSLAMTFSPACVGPDRPSRTATGTWQLSLAK